MPSISIRIIPEINPWLIFIFIYGRNDRPHFDVKIAACISTHIPPKPREKPMKKREISVGKILVLVK